MKNFNRTEKLGSQNNDKKREKEIMILYGVEMPRSHLEIIKKIASFFGPDLEEKAKKILVSRYFNDKEGNACFKTDNGGFLTADFLLQEQELAYRRREKSGDKPTIKTLELALRGRIHERSEPSGRRIKPKNTHEYDFYKEQY